jgi:hypothetical protein
MFGDRPGSGCCDDGAAAGSPRETDRSRFIELFRDEDFMVVYPCVLTEEQASDHFDHMVAVCETIPFGKQECR